MNILINIPGYKIDVNIAVDLYVYLSFKNLDSAMEA